MAKLVNNEITQDQIEAKVEEFSQKLEILRIRYEQYFIGVERVAPSIFRMDVVRLMRELEQVKIRNTSIKFKLNSAIQKFNAYSAYWNRTLREIEDGVYVRHKQRAQRRREERQAQEVEQSPEQGEELSPSEAVSPSDSVKSIAQEAQDFFEQYQSAQRPVLSSGISLLPPPSASGTMQSSQPSTGARRISIVAARAAAPTASTSQSAAQSGAQNASLSGAQSGVQSGAQSAAPSAPDHIDNLYKQLNDARQSVGLAPQSMKLSRFREQVEAQSRKLEQSHNASKIEYEVVIKNNQPFLKPIIKKG